MNVPERVILEKVIGYIDKFTHDGGALAHLPDAIRREFGILHEDTLTHVAGRAIKRLLGWQTDGANLNVDAKQIVNWLEGVMNAYERSGEGDSKQRCALDLIGYGLLLAIKAGAT